MRRDDAAAQKHGRVEQAAEVGDAGGMAAVFVSEGKEEEEIADRRQLGRSERGRAAGADAFDELKGCIGGNCHVCILREEAGFYGR